MKREILFRAWDKNRGKRGIMLSNHTFETIAKTGLYNDESLIWMQFTGLTDKNGTKIFEGDIVKMHRFTQILGENLGVMEGEVETTVTISLGVMGVMVDNEPLFSYFDEDFHDMSEPFEVIGNIYED